MPDHRRVVGWSRSSPRPCMAPSRARAPLGRRGAPLRRAVSVFQGRGELRAKPPPGVRVVTGAKGLFGPYRTTGGWWVARAVPRAPGCSALPQRASH
ncbi:hypothetical protein SBRY_10070 [Actinacidiphila bryophytorum]|uniref:Uncharacterized protein n=1 Tax=Actinacidiphila bryophytorum TaxID=1436133 RepID=A0A9W4EBZ0_9ACTN|nr:hypothetical protein SBRY_10070 [Actinacidiphila bryophytorum]